MEVAKKTISWDVYVDTDGQVVKLDGQFSFVDYDITKQAGGGWIFTVTFDNRTEYTCGFTTLERALQRASDYAAGKPTRHEGKVVS